MILEDCKNYREKMRECVESYITGKLTKAQALNLLESRYKFMLPEIPKWFSDDFGGTENMEIYNYADRLFKDGTMHISQITEFTQTKIKEVWQGMNSTETQDVLTFVMEMLCVTYGINELYKYCKNELENL